MAVVSSGGSRPKKPKPAPKPRPPVGGSVAVRAEAQTVKAPTQNKVRQAPRSTSTNQTVNFNVDSDKKLAARLQLNKDLSKAARTGKPMTMRDQPSRKDNADKFGFSAKQADGTRRKAGGGTATRDGGTLSRSGPRASNLGRPISEQGSSDGGRLGGTFRDRDIVGSENTIDDFDGSTFSGGGNEGGAGGGSGSSLAGRESVGLADVKRGESVDDVVYGVKKRSRKVSRARGE